MKNTEAAKKRALIMAGGGVKVAFQAGVLQVWLDEAGLTFDHADGASGGCFNLAMYCQGQSGTRIADNWRKLNPLNMISFNFNEYVKLFYAESIATHDGLREKVFPAWGLDWDQIRSSKKEATFNVYNFSKHELEVVTPDKMTEDYLCACVALPMWFPPVKIDGDLHIDSVYITDANIEEAIRRGADELWIIWTVSEKSEWNDGFVANYFQIIETSANGHLRRILRRVEDNNAAIASGQHAEFGRHIEVKMLKAEVALNYLINISQDRLTEAVNLGVHRARAWCKEQGIALDVPEDEYPTQVHTAQTKLQFTEEMKGFVTFGDADFDEGYKQGKKSGDSLMVRLTIKVDGVNRFIANPDHEASIEGYVRCESLGGDLPVESGVFNLLVDEADASQKQMLYRLHFTDKQGGPLTLTGFKEIRDESGFDVWSDTTTLFTRVFRGHIGPGEEQSAEVLASGIIKIHMLDFLKQLTTFRVEGPTLADKTSALARFGKLFLGKLWDVYAREVLAYSPF